MSQNDENSAAAVPADAITGAPIPLPPSPPRPPEDSSAPAGPWLNRLLVALVLLLALVLGSAPSRTSDLWLHMATGRQLLEAKASFGSEPFTYPQESSYWVNSSWLFDVVSYLVFSNLGGAALVGLKAALMVVLAAFMLAAARTSRNAANGSASMGLAALATSLALVAIGPWMVLRPICLSFAFLAWTIWFLERRERPSLSCWPLLVGFALWANLDRWFILGPTTVLLYAVGSLFPSREASAAGRPAGSSLAWFLLALGSAAACLLNPHHVYVYSVMGELGASEIAARFQVDGFLRAHFDPLVDVYFSGAGARTAAGWAFWLLGAAGFGSFFLSSAWPWRWGLLWASLGALCLLKTQFIPFFAIAGGIILSRNLGAWVGVPAPAAGLTQLHHGLGRFALSLSLIALVVAAWPGWLQLGAQEPRRWRVEIDPSMAALADDFIAKRQQPGLSKLDHVFNFSPDSANYLAWLCPEMKCSINSHLHLSADDAVTFLAVREGLSGVFLPGSANLDWRAALRQDKVGLLLIHGGDLRLTTAAMSNLFRADDECPIIALRGRAVLHGWRDLRQHRKPGSADPYAAVTLDLKRQAFGPDTPPLPAPEATVADARPRQWWEAFWTPRPAASAAHEEVSTMLTYFNSFHEDTAKRNEQLFLARGYAQFIADCGMPGPTAWLVATGQSATAKPAPTNQYLFTFLRQLDDGPVEALYQGIRSARRALADSPADAQLFFLLGETYDRLARFTRERNWGPVAGNLRTCQTLSAFRQAVERDPRHWRAHARLAAIYRSMDYRDLSLLHLRESVSQRTMERGESREAFEGRLSDLEKGLQFLDKEVKALTNKWEVNSANMRVSDRADMAGNLGLPGKALQVLLASDIAAFGAAGLEMELKLMLNSGDAAKVKQWLSPDHRGSLSTPSYYVIRAQSEAALGNYAEADVALGKMVGAQLMADKPISSAQLLALTVGNTLLYENGMGFSKLMSAPTRFQFPGVKFLNSQVRGIVALMQQQASAKVLQGLLAVEAGQIDQALRDFREAAAFWDSPAGAAFDDPRSEAGREITRYFVPLLVDLRR